MERSTEIRKGPVMISQSPTVVNSNAREKVTVSRYSLECKCGITCSEVSAKDPNVNGVIYVDNRKELASTSTLEKIKLN